MRRMLPDTKHKSSTALASKLELLSSGHLSSVRQRGYVEVTWMRSLTFSRNILPQDDQHHLLAWWIHKINPTREDHFFMGVGHNAMVHMGHIAWPDD